LYIRLDRALSKSAELCIDWQQTIYITILINEQYEELYYVSINQIPELEYKDKKYLSKGYYVLRHREF